jgi:hypothetical protein
MAVEGFNLAPNEAKVNVLIYEPKTYIQYQTRFRYLMIVLSRIERETLLDRVCFVDLLSLNEKNLSPLNKLDDPQLQFFYQTVVAPFISSENFRDR